MKVLKNSLHSLYSPQIKQRVKFAQDPSNTLGSIWETITNDDTLEIANGIKEYKIFDFTRPSQKFEEFSDMNKFGGKTEVKLNVLSDRRIIINSKSAVFAKGVGAC
jgi:hypothetical protein